MANIKLSLLSASQTLATDISISSGQRNLMKTYHNAADTGGITKIALNYFFLLFGTKKIDSQNCKNLTFKAFNKAFSDNRIGNM